MVWGIQNVGDEEELKKYDWQKMISEYINENHVSFTGGGDVKRIADIENELGVTFPDSYKCFLKNYGSGGLFGVEIVGCDYGIPPTVVELTKSYREDDMPSDFVIIEDAGEYQYCLQTSKMKDGECPVVNWAVDEDVIFEADDFSEFFLSRICDGEENWKILK